jgi:putative hydrolase of the HAD superfamily
MSDSKTRFKVIAFDADDTLWTNEPYFQLTQKRVAELLKEWIDPQCFPHEHYETEKRNLPLYGYGIKGFTLSLIETALRLSDHQLDASRMQTILQYGKAMLQQPLELLEGVEATLLNLQSAGHRLIVATKGDLLDQERKLEHSGLIRFFHHVEVMSEKDEASYRKLLEHLDLNAEHFLMVGNSLRSDILPVLNIGAWAIHIPGNLEWIHEAAPDFNYRHPRLRCCPSITELPTLLPTFINS